VIRKPNTIQKLLHRLVLLYPVSAFFAPRIHQIDKAILKLTKGQYTASEILGWNIVQLTSIGAKTGQARSLPLVGLTEKRSRSSLPALGVPTILAGITT
jgi:hypothetical protein